MGIKKQTRSRVWSWNQQGCEVPWCERTGISHSKCQISTAVHSEASAGVGYGSEGARENEMLRCRRPVGAQERHVRVEGLRRAPHTRASSRCRLGPARPKPPLSPRPPPDSTRREAGTRHTSRQIRTKTGPSRARNRLASRGPRAAAETATGSTRPGGGGSRPARDTTASGSQCACARGSGRGAPTGDAEGGAVCAQASRAGNAILAGCSVVRFGVLHTR